MLIFNKVFSIPSSLRKLRAKLCGFFFVTFFMNGASELKKTPLNSSSVCLKEILLPVV